MSDFDFKRMVQLFVLCMTLFRNSYYTIKPRHMSFTDDIEKFKNYFWGINMYDELLREFEMCRVSLITFRRRWQWLGRGKAKKLFDVYERCVLSLHVFVMEHIPASRIDLRGIVSPMILKLYDITKHKSLSTIQAIFAGTVKQVIMDLELKENEFHFLVG